MNYQLNLGAWGSVFAVPTCVVDHYIKIADEKKLKVLLYLLRNTSVLLRSEDIAVMTGVSAADAEDALLFWENVGVVASHEGALVPAGENPSQNEKSTAPIASVSNDGEKAAARVKLTAEPQFPPKEIASAVKSDEAVRYLFETFERLAGRPTKHSERNALMILVEEVGMPTEVAVMLVEYCFSIDRATPAYIKAAALEWCDSGIDTIGKAEERIKLLRARHTLEGRLRGLFGRTSAFSKSERELIALWAGAAYPDELYEEAYDLCMKNAGRLSLKYMDTVLKSWAEKGYTTAAQTRAEKKPEKVEKTASFNVGDFGQAAYARYQKLGEKKE
ncbi:MAG: DnaD domain protein [Bacteroides sp.]|nr:DnaD domain protein [Eubacterium sp.]MCM1418010.1 DnaD domain protein [Roseburia sp.]MCM1462167.1 DnaD domain protein [Bacteroides sp.]